MTATSWKRSAISDCLSPLKIPSKAKLQTKDYKASGKYPIVDQGQEYISGWTDDAHAVISEGLPLIVFGDHTRALKYVDMPFVRGADGTQILKPKRGINPLFFYYACRWLDIPSRGYNRHFGILKDSEINIPDTETEQERIGETLRVVDLLFGKQSVIVDQLRHVKSSPMHTLFSHGLRGEPQRDTDIGLVPKSWDVVQFQEVREWMQYGTSNKCTESVSRYPVLRIPNIEPAKVNSADLKYCDLPDSEAKRYLLEAGDIIFIRTNGVIDRLGSCAVYLDEPKVALFASYLIRARPKSGVNPRFIAYFFSSKLGSSLIADRATPAADGKYNLNTGIIDSLPLPMPKSVDEQAEIVEILDAIDRKIDLHKRKRAVLEELFKSLLHKLMTGEVRVSDLNLSALGIDAEPTQEATL